MGEKKVSPPAPGEDNVSETERPQGLLYITISILMGFIVTTILIGITPWQDSLLNVVLSIFDAVLLSGFFLTLYFYWTSYSRGAGATKDEKHNDNDHCRMCLGILVGTLALMLIMLIFILFSEQALNLPFAVVFAIAATVIILTIAATIFHELNLTSTKEALGLPKGTIRAIIALSLIVIFAIMIIFTLNNLKPVWVELPYNHTVTYNNGTIVYYPNGTKVLTQPSAAQMDFSIQMLTTISTLVVAIVGFYFGTRAVEVAKGVEPAPSLEITPESPTELNISINKEVDPIRATTTPANENVNFSVPKELGEITRKEKANEFKYKPSKDLIEKAEKGQTAEATLSFSLTNKPKISASLVVKISSGAKPATAPPPTTPELKITDPGDSVDMKQGETKKIVLKATPSEKTIAFKEKDEKVESVEEIQKEKGAFNIKVKGDATPGESTWVKFKLAENPNVEKTLQINVTTKDQ